MVPERHTAIQVCLRYLIESNANEATPAPPVVNVSFWSAKLARRLDFFTGILHAKFPAT
jgi:hypothetical protein